MSQSPIKPVVLGAQAMQAIYFATPTQVVPTYTKASKGVVNRTTLKAMRYPEEGEKCYYKHCQGRMRIAYPKDEGCTCFKCAPCSRCLSSYFECDTCFENQDDLYTRLLNAVPFGLIPKHRRRRILKKIKENDQRTNSRLTA